MQSLTIGIGPTTVMQAPPATNPNESRQILTAPPNAKCPDVLAGEPVTRAWAHEPSGAALFLAPT